MSGLLLDSHIFLAMAAERTDGLPHSVRQAIQAPDAQLLVSAASLWEIAIKWRLRKLSLSVQPKDLPDLCQNLRLALLIINERHAVIDIDPEPNTRDPFDRLLLAQCQVEGLRLVTLDRALAPHPLAWRAD